jgi:hypothetical protein
MEGLEFRALQGRIAVTEGLQEPAIPLVGIRSVFALAVIKEEIAERPTFVLGPGLEMRPSLAMRR